MGGSWEALGATLRLLGLSWRRFGRLGGVLVASWKELGASWSVLEPLGDVSGPSWDVLGASWGGFWGSWVLPGTILEAFLEDFHAS